MVFPIGFPTAYNNKNMLTGITPTWTNWTTQPQTPAIITGESNPVLSVNGVTGGLGNCYVTYDLGKIFRIVAHFYYRSTLSMQPYISVSDDNITYYMKTLAAVLATETSIMVAAKARYIRFSFTTDVSRTIDRLNLSVYRI